MKKRDWLVTGDGQCQVCETVREWDLLRDSYRLYRFLTEIEDVLTDVANETQCLPQIRMLVRRLITNSYWVQTQYQEPSPQTGISILNLYDELGFPLTVQTEASLPGTASPVHNHGTWGVVAVLKGKEKHTLWRRTYNPEFKYSIEQVESVTLVPGDIISFTPDAIHRVEAVGDELTVTFNLYGETERRARFEFNPITQEAKNF